MENYENGIEMDQKVVIANVLKSWKKIVLLMVILFTALMGYSYKKVKSNQTANDPSVASALLSNDQKQMADNTFSQYKSFYEQYQYYSSKSVSLINTLDPYQTPQMTLSYVISTDISNPVSFYQNMLLSSEQESSMSSLLNLNEQSSVNELIFVDSSTSNINQSDHINITLNNEEGNVAMDVVVVGVSEDNANAVADIISEAVNNETNLLAEKGFTVSCAEISRNWSTTYSQNVADYQSHFMEQLEKTTTQLNNLKDPASLSTEEKTYYQALVNKYIGTKSTNQTVTKKGIIKYVAASILLALILGYFIEVMKYLLTDKVKSSANLDAIGCGPVLSVIVPETKKKKCFSKQIQHLLTADAAPQDEAIRLAVSEIEKQMNRDHLQRLFICFSANDKSAKKIVNLMISPLSESVSVKAGSPTINADDYKQLIACDAVVFVETAFHSKENNVQKEVSLAKRNGIVSIGSLLINTVD